MNTSSEPEDDSDDSVRLGTLLELIDEARAPVSEALESTDDVPLLDFAELRGTLRNAYRLLGGDGDIDLRNSSLQAQRVAAFALVHFGAGNVMRLAQQAISEGESPQLTRELLHRSRELVAVVEKYLLKRRRATGDNVVAFTPRAEAAGAHTEGDDPA